jgi:hypothetical protein
MILQTILAIGLMVSGFTLYALFFYYKYKKWNGYKDKTNLIVALAIISILSGLLVNVPEVGEMLKMAIGLDVSIENSKVGFVSLGFALSAMLVSNHQPLKTKGDEKNN